MNRQSGRHQTAKSIGVLLQGLNGSDPGAAWAEFIDHFSPLILKMAQQFDYEQNRSGDCFLYVCEKLSENDFRRLLKFNTGGKATFRTWLSSVVFNLCVDWHRHEFGRATLLPAISALPEFDQSVYRLYFEQGMDMQAALYQLQEDFPDLNSGQLSESVARIHRVLTPRQRWKLGVKKFRQQRSRGQTTDPEALPSGLDDPERRACDEQAGKLLREALGRLSRDQALAVNLRYIQGMTLQQVADVLGLGDPFRARRMIQAALDQLSVDLPGSVLFKRQ